MNSKSKIKIILIFFITIIFIYMLLKIITDKYTETFCDTSDETSDKNEYQDVLGSSQLSQIKNMINTQTANIIRSAGNLIPGPRGLDGPQGLPGSTYEGSGYLSNNGKVLNNVLKMTDKNNSVNQIWYLQSDGKLFNKYFDKGFCLNDSLKTVLCNVAPKWIWNNIGQLKIGDKCLTNNNNTATMSDCNSNTSSSDKSWILN